MPTPMVADKLSSPSSAKASDSQALQMGTPHGTNLQKEGKVPVLWGENPENIADLLLTAYKNLLCFI